jgi:hypothetical protein
MLAHTVIPLKSDPFIKPSQPSPKKIPKPTELIDLRNAVNSVYQERNNMKRRANRLHTDFEIRTDVWVRLSKERYATRYMMPYVTVSKSDCCMI